MALLRALAELALRLVWCLYSDNPQKESREVRIKRWEKTSLIERKKYVQREIDSNISSAGDINGFKKELDTLEQMISKIQYEPAGRFFASLGDLPEPYKKDMYPLLYSTFNVAIHPDYLLLRHLVKEEGKSCTIMSDINENPVALKIYCLTMAFNIIGLIRMNYSWNYSTIKTEYLKIKKDFSEENES